MSCERYWDYSDSGSYKFFFRITFQFESSEKKKWKMSPLYICVISGRTDCTFFSLPNECRQPPADAWNNVDDISKWHRKQGRLFHLLCLAWWEVIFQLHKHSNLFVSAWTALFAFGRSYTINQPAVCLEFNLRGSWKGHDDWKNYSNQAASKVDKHPNLEM